MDERWKKRVFPILPALLEILLPLSLIDGLLSVALITVQEFEKLSLRIYDDVERSRMLLVSILPKKGPDSFDRFVSVLRETEGQEHVATKLLGNEHNEHAYHRARSEEKVEELERELKKEREEKNKEKVTNIGLRNKFSMGNASLKWKTNIPYMPIDCAPFGRVVEINGMLHVGWRDTMFQFKKGAWEGENHHLPGIWIACLFECERKGYVMDINDRGRCATIYEWKSETRELELLTEIPDEYQLKYRSAIGHNGNIFLVGGWGSDEVYCFDINKEEWEPIKKMKNEQWDCSLAVIDDKMFVGGGGWAGNSVECLSMEKQEWIDIKQTTEGGCQLSSWNGKLVATGGWDGSNYVEMYDELSGSWLPLPSMNQGRWDHGACTTKDNELIVVGGDWGARNSVECLKM